MIKQTRFAIALFAMILLTISLASATIPNLGITPNPVLLNSTSLSKTITLNNTGNTNITNISVGFFDLIFSSHTIKSGNLSVNLSNFNITNNSIQSILVTLNTSTIPSTQYAGNYTGTITFSTGSVSQNISVEYEVKENPSLSIETAIVQDNQNKTYVIVRNNGNIKLTGNLDFPAEKDGVKISSNDKSFDLEPTQTKNITLDLVISTSTRVETISIPIKAVTLNYNSSSADLKIQRSYCRFGNIGSLIRLYDIEDRSSDWDWEPMQIVRIRFYVDNLADSRKTITTKLALFDADGKTVWLSADEKELSDSQRIDSGDDARFEFEFTLPADFKINEKYYLHIKAYDKEAEQCQSDFKEIIIDSDEDVLIDEISYPTVINCDSLNQISFKVYNLNLGDEELMRVGLYNRELGINLLTSQFELDEGEDEEVSFDLKIPTGVSPKLYRFTVYIEYDYRDSSDSYRKGEDIQTISLNIQGDECVDLSKPVITATLNSDAIKGEEMIVSISVKNNANSSISATVSPEDFESWAELIGVSPAVLNINKGESGSFNITFVPTEDGQQTFNLNVLYSGKSINQPVTVSIEENDSWFSMLVGKFGKIGAYLIAGIVVLFILILLIILIRFIVKILR